MYHSQDLYHGRTWSECLNKYFSKSQTSCEKLATTTTDGASAKTGKKSEAVARIHHMVPLRKESRYIIHQRALTAKYLTHDGTHPTEFDEVPKALNSRLFRCMCRVAGADPCSPPVYDEMGRLSLVRAYEQFSTPGEGNASLRDEKTNLLDIFFQHDWICMFAYKVHIFSLLKILHIFL